MIHDLDRRAEPEQAAWVDLGTEVARQSCLQSRVQRWVGRGIELGAHLIPAMCQEPPNGLVQAKALEETQAEKAKLAYVAPKSLDCMGWSVVC